MKLNKTFRVRRMRDSERGQSIVLAMVVLFLLFAMAALTIDMGNLYFCYTKLVSATQAAADAGGQAIPTISNPSTVADNYSGSKAVSALYNLPTNNNMTIGTPTITFGCLTGTSATSYNLPPCVTNAYITSPAGGANAIKVTETATVTTFFAKVFGVSTLNIAATATASASGAGAIPYHVVMVLDSTASMGSTNDTGCLASNPGGSYSAEECAQYGIQSLLQELSPCASIQGTCGSSTPIDEVALMTFPGLCDQTAAKESTASCNPTTYSASSLKNTTANATYAPDDYSTCGTNPPIAAYNNDPEYLIIPFENTFRTSDSAGLNAGDSLVESVAASTKCGIQTPGGEQTFYAGVIVAAQQYLMANHTSTIQDVIIMLSDGNATATGATGNTANSNMAGSVKQTVTIAGTTNGLWQSANSCAQAVAAADWAKGYKEPDGTYTQIYSVSFNSANVDCANDTPKITDCTTMEDIGSTPSSKYFFSVPGKSGSVTCAGAVAVSDLYNVFPTIAGDLETARLIPNGLF